MMTPLQQINIQASYSRTDDLSDAIIGLLGEINEETGYSIFAVAMTLGRLLAPGPLTAEDEIKFIQDCLDWGGMYWSGGELN